MVTMNSQSPAKLNRVLQQIGVANNVGPSGQGQAISGQDAGKILDHLKGLPAVEQRALQSELVSLLKTDAFVLDPSTRKTFAQAFGLQVEELTPKQKAQMGAGVAQSLAQTTIDRLAKPTSIKRSDMNAFVDKAKEFLPPFLQNIVVDALQDANNGGALKFDSGARKEFVSWKASVASEPSLETAKEFLGLNKTPESSYLDELLASGGSFEDIVLAFLASVAASQSKEQMSLMREIEANEQQLARRGNLKQQADALRRGGAAMPDASGATPKNANAVIDDLLGTKPAPTEPKNFDDALAQTKSALDNLTHTVDEHVSNDGMISLDEAKSIANRLDALPANVDKLIAGSLKNAIVHSELSLDLTSGGESKAGGQNNLGPIVDWVESKLGQQNWDPVHSTREVKTADGSGVMQQKYLHKRGDRMTGDLAAKLFKKGDQPGEFRLENKISAFIVDSLFVKDSGKMSKMEQIDAITNKLTDKNDALGAKMANTLAGPKSTEYAQEIPQETKMQGAQPGLTLGENIDAALEKANATGKPVTLHFADDPVVVMPGSSRETALADFGERAGVADPENAMLARKGESLEKEVGRAVDKANGSGTPATLFFNQQKITCVPGADKAEVVKDAGQKLGWGTDASGMTSVGQPSMMTLEEIEKELASTPEPKSREMMFEKLKQANQKMSEFMQLMGAIANSIKTVMDAIIRGIR